jgi:isoquinoline 1-oxidoreductase
MTTRRGFLKTVGGGLVVVIVAPRLSTLTSFGESTDLEPHDALAAQSTDQIAAWLHVDERGLVTVYTGKVEFGQGIRTSLTQHVAEELRAPVDSIRLVMGDTELTPYDMGTFGSRSTPQMGLQLRRVGASARELLIGLAAEKWNVDRARLVAEHGRVVDPQSKRSLGYGELTAGRKLTETIRDDVAPKPATQWTIAGTSLPRIGARDIVTGRHQYTSDMRLPGMLVGRVLRAPAMGATLANVDTSAASAIDGAIVVRDGTFVGVAAPNGVEAERALDAIRPTWTTASETPPSAATVYEHIRGPRRRDAGMAGGGEGPRSAADPFVQGDVASALAVAEHKLERTYTVAYIAHVPLEPRAAVAQWTRDAEGEKLTVWTGTQRPFAVRDELGRRCACRRRACASSSPIRARATAASTRARWRSKRRGSRRARAGR